MNIGLFTDTYFPQVNGVATSVLTLKKNLEAQGHTVSIFTTTDPDAPLQDEDGVYRVSSLPFFSDRRMGVFCPPWISRKIKSLNLDIIHTHTEFSLGILAHHFSTKLGIPMVHTLHTIYEDYTHHIVRTDAFSFATKSIARSISRHFCNLADSVIVPTEKVAELLKSYGVYKEVSVIPTGIVLDKFSSDKYDDKKVELLRKECGLKDTDKVLLYIGRISKEKNMDEIIVGLADYLPGRPDVKFVVVGDGHERPKLEEMTKERGIEEQVIFMGEKPWEQIGLYYRLGDLFISASQSESQGLTYVEALASGLPLVAKADKCLVNVLKDGENGYSFTNENEMNTAIETILNDDLLRSKMSHEAVLTSARFSAEEFANSVEKFYIKMLKKHENVVA